jgi:hypothetical protein
MTFTEIDGVTPMANANVGVFYLPPSEAAAADGTTVHLTELASGTTDASGQFSAAVGTSAIAPSNLADVGDGTPDAFNAIVEALDSSGNLAVSYQILTEGSTFAGTASVNDPAPAGTAQTTLAAPLSGQAVVLAHAFRYTPIAPLNSGYGMQATLTFTTSTETSRQTEVQVGEVQNGGGVTIGGYQIEDQSRAVLSPFTKSGSYHYWVWTNYEYKEYKICGANCTGGTVAVWKPYENTGQAITDLNPDCCFARSAISLQAYAQPTFTPGSSNQNWFALTPNNTGWQRTSGTREGNSDGTNFYFPFASSIVVNSLTTYGSITTIKYDWIPSGNCGSGYTRVIWGYNATPRDTQRVQANCFKDSQL